MRNVHRATWLAVSLVGAAGGDGPTGPEAGACTDETVSVAVTVDEAANPSINWSPACAVALFLVEGSSGDTWGVGTDDALWGDASAANLITPPLTYGSIPSGSDEFQAPTPLIRGASYDVIVWRVLPSGSTASCPNEYQGACRLAVHTFVH